MAMLMKIPPFPACAGQNAVPSRAPAALRARAPCPRKERTGKAPGRKVHGPPGAASALRHTPAQAGICLPRPQPGLSFSFGPSQRTLRPNLSTAWPFVRAAPARSHASAKRLRLSFGLRRASCSVRPRQRAALTGRISCPAGIVALFPLRAARLTALANALAAMARFARHRRQRARALRGSLRSPVRPLTRPSAGLLRHSVLSSTGRNTRHKHSTPTRQSHGPGQQPQQNNTPLNPQHTAPPNGASGATPRRPHPSPQHKLPRNRPTPSHTRL